MSRADWTRANRFYFFMDFLMTCANTMRFGISSPVKIVASLCPIFVVSARLFIAPSDHFARANKLLWERILLIYSMLSKSNVPLLWVMTGVDVRPASRPRCGPLGFGPSYRSEDTRCKTLLRQCSHRSRQNRNGNSGISGIFRPSADGKVSILIEMNFVDYCGNYGLLVGSLVRTSFPRQRSRSVILTLLPQ